MKKVLLRFACMFIACFISFADCRAQSFDPYHYGIQKDIRTPHGAVVSAHPLASEVGATILKKGGNAVDAAVATQLALAVVYPGAGIIG